MTAFTEAAAIMHELRAETKGIREGQLPSPYVLLDIYSRLVEVYTRLSESSAESYRGQVKTYLDRRMAQAESYKHNRLDEEMTAKDAEMHSLLAVGEEFQKEVDALAEHEGCRTILRAADRGIDFCRSVLSFLKAMEQRPA